MVIATPTQHRPAFACRPRRAKSQQTSAKRGNSEQTDYEEKT
jgi:hypothetical protein